MDEKVVKMIKERFDSLPEMIQGVIISSDYEKSLIEISKKYNLTVEQMGVLEKETTFVMMGLSPIGDFEGELAHELNVDKAKGAEIVKEINEKVFLNIRALLKLMYTPKGEEPKLDETLIEGEMFQGERNSTENKETPIEEIKSTDLSAQRELSSPIGDQAHPLINQKLSGSFKIPTVETEHFVNNLTKDSEKEATTPKIDPYRELPI